MSFLCATCWPRGLFSNSIPGDDGGYHNILIDGGNRNQLEFNIQKRMLISIIDNGNKGIFDLVIVTHSDDDHISGILKIMGDSDLEPLVKELWFNSEKQ